MQTVFQWILVSSYILSFIIFFLASLTETEAKVRYDVDFLARQTLNLAFSFLLLYCCGAFDKLF